jgi:hypothetical protein
MWIEGIAKVDEPGPGELMQFTGGLIKEFKDALRALA